MQTVMIQVRFKEKTEHGEFNDALYYTESEYASVTQKDIDKEKKKRVDAWVDIVKNPPPYIEPTDEELIKMADDLESEKQNYLDRVKDKTKIPNEFKKEKLVGK